MRRLLRNLLAGMATLRLFPSGEGYLEECRRVIARQRRVSRRRLGRSFRMVGMDLRETLGRTPRD